MTDLLSWTYRVDEIGPDGLKLALTADETQRRNVAAALAIATLDALSLDAVIQPSGRNGRYRMTGRLAARLTQSCVVTLEPVVQTIEEEIDLALWPADEIGPLSQGEHSVLEADIPEPIEHGRIAVGRIAYEHLSAAIDPYPRKPDASFDGLTQGPGGPDDRPASPFAVLARLKGKPAGGGDAGG